MPILPKLNSRNILQTLKRHKTPCDIKWLVTWLRMARATAWMDSGLKSKCKNAFQRFELPGEVQKPGTHVKMNDGKSRYRKLCRAVHWNFLKGLMGNGAESAGRGAGVGSEGADVWGEWTGRQAGKDGWWMVLIQEAALLYLGRTSQTCRGDGWAVSSLFMDHHPSPISHIPQKPRSIKTS